MKEYKTDEKTLPSAVSKRIHLTRCEKSELPFCVLVKKEYTDGLKQITKPGELLFVGDPSNIPEEDRLEAIYKAFIARPNIQAVLNEVLPKLSNFRQPTFFLNDFPTVEYIYIYIYLSVGNFKLKKICEKL